MSAAAIKGWCPGALRPMQSGDGLVVRVRFPREPEETDDGAGPPRNRKDQAANARS